jgi:hypothetical protein
LRDGLEHRHAWELLLQVDLAPVDLECETAEGFRDRLHEVFDECHRVLVVDVRLVSLEHRELGVVLG